MSEVAHGIYGGGSALPRGSRLQEFEVESLIGKGGFSIVYRARDTQLGRVVALKEYLPTALAQRSAGLGITPLSQRHGETFQLGLRSFVNEAQLLASFDHPSLVKVYRFWEENGTAYMATPLYHGPTLAEWLHARDGPPDEAWLRALLAPLLDALELIHANHCYHRDIAPDNILLLDASQAAAGSAVANDDAPHPVLLDFGAARRVIGDATQALTVILKPGYAPIEQYSQTALMRQGPWTDIYALCALLYRALTGRTPMPSVGRLVHDEHVPVVTAAHGRCSTAFLRAIDLGMAVKPQERPQSVSELRALFDGAMPAQTVMAAAVRQAGPGAAAGGAAVRPASALASAPVSEPASASANALASAPVTSRSAPAPRADDALPTVALPALPRPLLAGEAPFAPPAEPRGHRTALLVIAAATVAAIGGGVWHFARLEGATPPAPAVAAAPSPAAAPAATPSLASAATESAALPFSVLGALNDIAQGADPQLQVDVRADQPTLAIGRDALRLRVRASHAGHVYVFTGGTEKSHFYLLFPNRLDRNNRIEAGKELVLPRPSWEVTAGGPPGINQIVVMVSRSPRDLSGTGIVAAGKDIPEFDLAQAAERWAQKSGAVSPFIGTVSCKGAAGDAACAEGYGARLIEIEETARP